jgi:hypothetical protein
MTILSDTCLLVTLPSGNKAIYAVPPHQLNDRPGTTLNERAYMYGRQIAVKFGDMWHKTEDRSPITDNRTISLLERCPVA